MDGGSTDEVVLEIISSWPQDAWALRDYLLGLSPFLSVEALQEMVTKNTMPHAMQTEVMVANPEATSAAGFIQWVRDHAPAPFPEYMLAQIEASWDTKTYRFTLEVQMAEYHANMTQAANALLQYYSRDTIGEPIDSLRWVWQQVRTPAARYSEALTYMAESNYTAARNVVEGIPLEHDLRSPQMVERQRMLDVIAFMDAIAADERTDAELTSSEQDDLELLIADAQDRPAAWAQNLLCYAYDRCRAWPTGGDGTDWRVMVAAVEEPSAEEEPAIRLAPNPSSAWCAVNYSLTTPPTAARLEVVDVTGRSVANAPVQVSQGQWVLDTRNLAPGNYAVQLVNNGVIAGSEQLQVKD